MKMIVAYVQPFMESQVLGALHAMPEVSGATFELVRGFGCGRFKPAQEGAISGISFSKVRIEVAVADPDADAVLRAIQRAAHSGHSGDGKIFVVPVEGAVRISTGEEGDRALCRP
jgi:nitrogen regulatory protein PII